MLQQAVTWRSQFGTLSPILSPSRQGRLHDTAFRQCNKRFEALRLCPLGQKPLRAATWHTKRLANSTYGAFSRASYATAVVPQKQPIIHDIFEKATGSWQYIVADPATAAAAIIDPVLDFDPSKRELATESADHLVSVVNKSGYIVERILETHIHADHITAATYLRNRLRDIQELTPTICIGKRIGQIQELLQKQYDISPDEINGVHQCLLDDDEHFHIGKLQVQAIHLPGHTPDHMGYKIGDNIFCGDSIFAVDLGSSRCDFPGGNAKQLYKSAQKMFTFPNHVKLWSGHDYPSDERSRPVPYYTVGEHKNSNKHFMNRITQDDFVSIREGRDATLKEPKLLHQSLQLNARGGRLPKVSSSGHYMLQVPITVPNGGW